MENQLSVRRQYIDRRFKTSNGSSSSDFQCDLPEAISLPYNDLCYRDNIVIPNSWKTIDACNNKLDVGNSATGTGAPIDTDKIITVGENKAYAQTLRYKLLSKLTAAFGNVFTLTNDEVCLRYNIDLRASTLSLRIFTDNESVNDNDFGVA